MYRRLGEIGYWRPESPSRNAKDYAKARHGHVLIRFNPGFDGRPPCTVAVGSIEDYPLFFFNSLKYAHTLCSFSPAPTSARIFIHVYMYMDFSAATV